MRDGFNGAAADWQRKWFSRLFIGFLPLSGFNGAAADWQRKYPPHLSLATWSGLTSFNGAAADWQRKWGTTSQHVRRFTEASMGPLPIGSGNKPYLLEGVNAMVALQWGRCRLAAEIVSCMDMVSFQIVSFNGAAADWQRKLDTGTYCDDRIVECFNGAAADWQRKFLDGARVIHPIRSASMGPLPIGSGNASFHS